MFAATTLALATLAICNAASPTHYNTSSKRMPGVINVHFVPHTRKYFLSFLGVMGVTLIGK